MKNLLLVLITIPLIFGSCNKDEDEVPVINYGKLFCGTGSNIGYSVQQTTDGGYIITGMTRSNEGRYVCLIKTDGNGNEQWNKTISRSSSDIGYSVQQTTDGGYIITGGTSGGMGSCVYLIKTDENGDVLN